MNNAIWGDPLEYATALENEENLFFLYSGMAPGRFSFLAWGLLQKLDSLDEFKQALSGDKKWFGYLGYGLRNELETLPRGEDSIITLPDFLMMNFENLIVFDHELETVIPANAGIQPRKNLNTTNWVPACTGMTSNMTDQEYLQKAAQIIEEIHAGELYQANLTRKFFGEFTTPPNTLSLFCKLAEISPAPYSAYIKFGKYSVISASPEKFLSIESGIATTSPIKGTLRAESPAALLAMSQKDRAENLMIVDLMRNDLSKTCKNVQVTKLFEITSYAKYHHMSSTIIGSLQGSALDVALGCFPPGSMTGAPKIHAMRLCSELEKLERGVYSGAIGYFEGTQKCDLSVVIRTLIVEGNKFEFQVGGGIVADSTPEKELEEIYVKARPILETLGHSLNG